jgi:hypothetical protein
MRHVRETPFFKIMHFPDSLVQIHPFPGLVIKNFFTTAAHPDCRLNTKSILIGSFYISFFLFFKETAEDDAAPFNFFDNHFHFSDLIGRITSKWNMIFIPLAGS